MQGNAQSGIDSHVPGKAPMANSALPGEVRTNHGVLPGEVDTAKTIHRSPGEARMDDNAYNEPVSGKTPVTHMLQLKATLLF